jgi:hypothetical protein
MRELADPGEVGTESLATNAAGEITRNRAVMREMKGTTQWYETYTTRTTTGTFTLPSADGTWTPTGTTIAFYRFHIPDGWLPGSDVFLFYMRRAAGGGGTKARMTAQVLRHRNNTALAVLASADVDFQPADVQNHLGSILISGGSLAVGDFINVQITRLGDYVGPPGGDDDLPAVAPDGHYFQYTGIASR